jgi:hypothetical protein
MPIGNGHFAAAAGIIAHAGTDYSLWDIIDATAREGGSLRSKMERLDKNLTEPLTRTATRLRNQPDRFHVEVAFFAVESGVAKIAIRDYMSKVGAGGEVSLDSIGCFACLLESLPRFFLMGTAKEAIVKSWKNLPSNVEPLKRILDSIVLAIGLEPKRVGPPINVLRINGQGATWIEGGEVCGEATSATRRDAGNQ